MDIVSTMQPLIRLQKPMDTPLITSSAAIQRTSFCASGFSDVNAGAGSFDTLTATLGKRLWEFDIQMAQQSNYIQATLFSAHVRLVYPASVGGGTIYLAGMLASGTASDLSHDNIARRSTLLIPVDGVELRYQCVNNAAGNRMVTAFSLIANKLA